MSNVFISLIHVSPLFSKFIFTPILHTLKFLHAFNMALVSGSVTDILSAAGAVRTLIETLKDAQNTPLEYQAMIRKIKNFDTVLGDLQDLAHVCDRIRSYESLAQRARLEALKCRALIVSYRDKIAQYRRSLREGGSSNLSRDKY